MEHPQSKGEGVICRFTFNNPGLERQIGSINVNFKDSEDYLICRAAPIFLARDFVPRWENVTASAGTAVTAGSVKVDESGTVAFVAVGYSPQAVKATRAYVCVTMMDNSSYEGAAGGEGLDIVWDD